MTDKIALAPGQESAEYRFDAASLLDLGDKLDDFYRQLDFNVATPGSSISVDMPFHILRSYQNGVERVSYGRPSATLTVYRRGSVE